MNTRFDIVKYLDRLFKVSKLKSEEIRGNLSKSVYRDPFQIMEKMHTCDIGVVVEPDIEIYPLIVPL